MLDRNLKVIFTALLGLMALIYVLQNFVNLEAAYGALGYVLSLQDHEGFARNMFPALGSPFSQVAAWIVFAFELATGVVLLWGAWRLWSARGADPAEYRAATRAARLGAGLAVITWFGLFGVFGGAAYQMWQTEVGSGSLNDAFKFSVWGFLLLLYLGQRETDTTAA